MGYKTGFAALTVVKIVIVSLRVVNRQQSANRR